MEKMHNKDYFTDYLEMNGYTKKESSKICNRVGELKGTKRDYLLFYQYIATNGPLIKHLTDL